MNIHPKNDVKNDGREYALCTTCNEIKCVTCGAFVRLDAPVSGQQRTGRCRDCMKTRLLPKATPAPFAATPLLNLEAPLNLEGVIDAEPQLDREPLLMPRYFHFVWVGQNPLPEKDLRWMRSWKNFHPDWRAFLWAEHPELLRATSAVTSFEIRPLPPLVNRRFYDEIETWVTGKAMIAARSDIVRYEIVARYGGVYLDTDVECFGPMERLLGGVKLFYSDEWGPCEGNYMFGAAPNHPALWTIVRELGPHLNANKEPLGVLEATGPHYFAPRMRTHPDCVIFPHMFFNPLHARADGSQVTQWPTVSLGNHHYDGKWYEQTKVAPPQEFVQEFVQENAHETP